MREFPGVISPEKKIFNGPGESDGRGDGLDWVVGNASLT